MNTVGVFAGRGDVILGMGFAVIFGTMLGWHLKKWTISWCEKWDAYRAGKNIRF